VRLFVNWLAAGNLEPPSHYRWVRVVPWCESYWAATTSLYGAVVLGIGEYGKSKHLLYYLLGDDPNAPPGPDIHGGEVVSLTKVGDSPPTYDTSPYSVEVDQAHLHTFTRQFAREKKQAERIKKMVDGGYQSKVTGAPRKELRKPFAWLAKQWKRVVTK
jgi:hypothetical protein